MSFVFSLQPDWQLSDGSSVWLNERRATTSQSRALTTHRVHFPTRNSAHLDTPGSDLSLQLRRESRQLSVVRASATVATFQHASRVLPVLGSISAVDVAPSFVAVGNDAGDVLLCDADGALLRRVDAPLAHVGDVTRLRFFASGVVLLSAGIDGRCQVIDATDGEVAATLAGHSGAVLGVAMVDRGRTLFSSGRDGAVKLWDVSQQACLQTLRAEPRTDGRVALHDCCVGENGVALAVCESGQVFCFDPRQSLAPVVTLDVSAAALRAGVTTNGGATLWCGDERGVVTVTDLRSPATPLHRLYADVFVGEITSLAASNGAVFVGTSAGLLHEHRDDATATLGRSFTGANVDPVHCAAHGMLLASGTRDGELRLFDL
jgi:WD40 repeat protein